MRLHIELADGLVEEIDRTAGPRGRSKFIREAIQGALRHDHQRRILAETRGSIAGLEHDWDADPSAWVRAQRQADVRRLG